MHNSFSYITRANSLDQLNIESKRYEKMVKITHTSHPYTNSKIQAVLNLSKGNYKVGKLKAIPCKHIKTMGLDPCFSPIITPTCSSSNMLPSHFSIIERNFKKFCFVVIVLVLCIRHYKINICNNGIF